MKLLIQVGKSFEEVQNKIMIKDSTRKMVKGGGKRGREGERERGEEGKKGKKQCNEVRVTSFSHSFLCNP